MKNFPPQLLAFAFFLSVNILSSNVNAQPIDEVLPPVVDLILNQEREPIIVEPQNNAPVNIVPRQPLEFVFDQIQLFQEVSVAVDDVDGNLASIQFTSPQSPASVRLNLLNNQLPGVIFEQDARGFTITGSQANLVNAIEQFIFIPISGDTTYLISMISTDDEGVSDLDTFFIEITGDGGGLGGVF